MRPHLRIQIEAIWQRGRVRPSAVAFSVGTEHFRSIYGSATQFTSRVRNGCQTRLP